MQEMEKKITGLNLQWNISIKNVAFQTSLIQNNRKLGYHEKTKPMNNSKKKEDTFFKGLENIFNKIREDNFPL